MKIAIIGSKGLPAKYGGVQNVVENLYTELAKKNIDITVYSRKYYSSIKKKKYVYRGLNIINIGGINTKYFDTISHCFLSSVIVSIKDYDLIIYHSYLPGLFAFIPKLFNHKTILHLHGVKCLESNSGKIGSFSKFLLLIFVKLTKMFFDGITNISFSQLELSKKIYRKNDIRYIPDGIKLQDNLGNFKHGNYILFVGRIVSGKGLEYLIEAFNDIKFYFPKYRLLIVGEVVNDKSYFNKILKSYDLTSIKFLGTKTGFELINLYSKAFCVVVPSEFESFGLVLLESLYYNGVVICSDIEQFKFLVGDYVEYFKSKSVDSLKDKLTLLISDIKYRKKLKANSKNYNFSRFSWKLVSDEYLKFYRTIIKKNNEIYKNRFNC